MKFHEYIAANLDRKFVWGEHDCVTFSAGWISILASKDVLEEYGDWNSAKTGLRAIQRAGGIQRQLDNRLKPIAPILARDGDVTLLGNSLMLFTGSKIVGAGKDGLVFKDRKLATCAWSYF